MKRGKPDVDHVIGIMVGGVKPKGAAGPDDGDGADDESAREDAAQDVLDAIKKGDAKALDEALATHYAMCAHHGEPGEDDEDEYADKE